MLKLVSIDSNGDAPSPSKMGAEPIQYFHANAQAQTKLGATVNNRAMSTKLNTIQESSFKARTLRP